MKALDNKPESAMTIDFVVIVDFFVHIEKIRKTKNNTKIIFIRIDIANIGGQLKIKVFKKTNNCVPRKSVRLVGCCDGLITLIDVMNDVSIWFYPYPYDIQSIHVRTSTVPITEAITLHLFGYLLRLRSHASDPGAG